MTAPASHRDDVTATIDDLFGDRLAVSEREFATAFGVTPATLRAAGLRASRPSQRRGFVLRSVAAAWLRSCTPEPAAPAGGPAAQVASHDATPRVGKKRRRRSAH